MSIDLKRITMKFKPCLLLAAFMALAACSVNPATGRSQFTGLMSSSQENQVGAQEHPKIMAEFGDYNKGGLQSYVQKVGEKVTKNTERENVQYKFHVLDSPIVNAFALPGGYIYVSRGLLALANSEAELAAVLAHEAGHITGRHSAERYSRSVVTSLGANILSSVVDKSGVSQALGIGADLYLKSYSRDQENEADTLGIRYLARTGYSPEAMVHFLQNLQNSSSLEARLAGQGAQSPVAGYFSTHPATQDRVTKTNAEARQALANGQALNREAYMQKINGMTYGESERHGLIRGQDFYHPGLGFGFSAPDGFKLINGTKEVVARGNDGSVILFDMAGNKQNLDPYTYVTQLWMKGETLKSPESITINGMRAATAAFGGKVNGKPSTIRVVAIEYKPGTMARFQLGIPTQASSKQVEGLKRATYSFHKLSAEEKARIKPYRLMLYKAASGDSVAKIAARQPFKTFSKERFRVLNALKPGQEVQAGQTYKIVVD